MGSIYYYLLGYYLPRATKVCCFTTDCHKSVVFYYRLPQKCGILLHFTDIYHISVVFYYSLTQKCGLEMYPKNGVQTNYVPQVPHVGYRWGTKTSTPQDGKY